MTVQTGTLDNGAPSVEARFAPGTSNRRTGLHFAADLEGIEVHATGAGYDSGEYLGDLSPYDARALAHFLLTLADEADREAAERRAAAV